MAQFLGTSTTDSGVKIKDEENVAESSGFGSTTYVLGASFFSIIFTCVFVLAWCHLRGAWKNTKLHSLGKDASSCAIINGQAPKIAPCTAEQSSSANSLEMLQADPGATETLATSATSPDATSADQQAKPIKSISVPPTCVAANGLQEQPYAEDSASLGGWVGSADWHAARVARKRRLQGGIFSKPGNKRRHTDVQSPPTPLMPPKLQAPLTPPPKLHVLPVDMEDAESRDVLSATNAGVHEQLKSTAMESVDVRRKMFKGLCARWHPDKNLHGDEDLATQVFQFLQSQREWYLRE